MYTTTQILTPNIKISYNWCRCISSGTLFMFMKLINDYEPGISRIIEEMCGVYKNKDPKEPEIYNYLKYKYTPTLSFCSMENILLRKIHENIIKDWTIYIHHLNPSIIEAIYQDTPFKKKTKRNKKGKNKKKKTIPRYQSFRICISTLRGERDYQPRRGAFQRVGYERANPQRFANMFPHLFPVRTSSWQRQCGLLQNPLWNRINSELSSWESRYE